MLISPWKQPAITRLGRERRAALSLYRSVPKLGMPGPGTNPGLARDTACNAEKQPTDGQAEPGPSPQQRWDKFTDRLVSLSSIPFSVLVLPQVVQNLHNMTAGNTGALSIISWEVRMGMPSKQARHSGMKQHAASFTSAQYIFPGLLKCMPAEAYTILY